jgi:hypothetical protein
MEIGLAEDLKSKAKALVKPAYMSGLAVWTTLRMAFLKPGKRHALPHRLVVSLTSYPKRFDVLHLTIKSILAQDMAADVVVLWVAHDDIRKLPHNVRELEERGLTIRATDDLRSYKKIIPALVEYADAIIVTADDDVYYPRHWLRTFCEAYRPGEREVLCYRAHRIAFDEQGIAPYADWTFEISDTKPSSDVFFTGVGGVFYPPGIFHDDVADRARLMELCPSTDDVWLNWMVRLGGAKIRKVGPKLRFHEWGGSQAVALQNTNRFGTSGNDQQLANIIRAYGYAGVQP